MMGEPIKGEKPEEIKSTQQYGLTVKEYIVSLWSIGVTSLDRLQKLVSKHLGIEVSEGTVSKIIVDFATECGRISYVVKDYLKKCGLSLFIVGKK